MDKKSRRNALKALAVGAPAVWAKPVVDSVVLPVHASTTCAGCIQLDDSPPSYVNFCEADIPNYLVHLNSLYSDSNCSNRIDAIGVHIAYAPQGPSQAVPLCQINGLYPCIQRDNPNIWECGAC